MIQEEKTSEFNINEYYCYYYFINTIIIDIFKKRYTITKNIISDYLTKTNKIFNELFRKIIKDEIPYNPELSTHLIDTFNTNSNLSLKSILFITKCIYMYHINTFFHFHFFFFRFC